MTTTTTGTTTAAAERVNRQAEAEILSAILHSPGVLRDLADGYRGEHPPLDWSMFGDRQTRPIARAVWELHGEGLTITVGSIAGRIRDLDNAPQLVRRLDDRAVPAMVDSLPLNINEVFALASDRQYLRDLRKALAEAEATPRQSVTMAQALQRRLSDISARRARRRDGSAGAIVASGKHREISIGRPIGLRWLDDLGDPRVGRPGMLGGLGRGEKLILAANPGGGKTGTTIFLVTSMAMPLTRYNPVTGEHEEIPPERVLYFMTDDTRENFAAWAISQLAVAKLIRDKADANHYLISSRGNVEGLSTVEQLQAIAWAEGIFARMPITIRDGADDIHNFDTVMDESRDQVLNEGSTLIVADYMQDMMVPGVKLDDTKAQMIAQCARWKPFLTEMGSKYGVKFIGCSQRPESANAFGAQGEAAGLLGGGALYQFANYVLSLSRPRGKAELHMGVIKARTAARGVQNIYQIIPSNGRITNPRAMPQVPSDTP